MENEKEEAKAEKNREKQLSKKNHPHRRAIKSILVSLVIGAIIGAGAVLWIQNNKPNANDGQTSVSIVFDRVLEQNELVTASQKYQIVEKVEDVNKLGDIVEIPFTKNSYWYRYVGTIKAAVDLSKAKLVSQNGNKITISLEQPYISSNTPDMDESEALEENNNILNPIHIKDVDKYKKKCAKKVEAEAKEGDLFNEAKKNAEQDLIKLFNVSLGGKYEIAVQWQNGDK